MTPGPTLGGCFHEFGIAIDRFLIGPSFWQGNVATPSNSDVSDNSTLLLVDYQIRLKESTVIVPDVRFNLTLPLLGVGRDLIENFIMAPHTLPMGYWAALQNVIK